MEKQAYFTENNIDFVGKELLANVALFREKHTNNFAVHNSALLIIDMQQLFLHNTAKTFIPSMPAIVGNIKKLQDFYLAKDLFILQTKHIDDSDKLMKQWWQATITHNDAGADIIVELANKKIPVLQKTQYDAFLYTNLEEQLKKHNIKQVIITGVMTNLCCETTARSAFMRGFEVFFTIDGTAANNRNFHTASLLNLSYGFAVPVLVDELLGWANATV